MHGLKGMANNRAPVDANDEVEPWLYSQIKIRIPQDLEAVRSSRLLAILGCITVQTGHEPVERVEHRREFLRKNLPM